MNTEAFRRLLRWYPRWWRERNGEVLLGTLLSDAQRRGADRPDMGERVSAFVHGLGLRMDVKLAWYCSALALATSAVGAAPANWGVSVSEKWPLYWSAVAALLLGIAWLSWLCRWGLSGPRALLCVLLLGVQVPLSVLAVSRGLETVALDEAWWTAPFFGTDALLRLSVLALMVGICFVATHGVFAHRINGPGWLVVVLATGITVCASPLLSVLALAGTVLPALLTVNWLMCGRQKKTEKPLPGRVPRAIFIIAGALAVPGLWMTAAGEFTAETASPGRAVAAQAACAGLILMFLGWAVWSASLRRRGVGAPNWPVFALAMLASGCYCVSFGTEPRYSLIAVLAGGILGALALGVALWLGLRRYGLGFARVLVVSACVAFLSIGFPEPMWVSIGPIGSAIFALRRGQARQLGAEPAA